MHQHAHPRPVPAPEIEGFDTPEQATLAHAIARYAAAVADAEDAATALRRAALAAIATEDGAGLRPALLTVWRAAVEAA